MRTQAKGASYSHVFGTHAHWVVARPGVRGWRSPIVTFCANGTVFRFLTLPVPKMLFKKPPAVVAKSLSPSIFVHFHANAIWGRKKWIQSFKGFPRREISNARCSSPPSPPTPEKLSEPPPGFVSGDRFCSEHGPFNRSNKTRLGRPPASVSVCLCRP